MEEYLAHYDKNTGEKQLLKEHLDYVAKMNERVLPTLEFDNIDSVKIKEIAFWIGYFHDFGKYSDYFQNYLKQGKDSRLKDHAHISACYLYSFLLSNVNYTNLDDKSKDILNFLCYLVVKLHHTSLKIQTSGNTYTIEENLNKLADHLKSKSDEIFKDINLKNELNLENFKQLFEDAKNCESKFEHMPTKFSNGRISDPKWYFILIYLFSLLIDTDKLDSANIEVKNIINISPPTKVVDYLSKKNNNNPNFNLAKKREKARKSMLEVINKLSDEEIKNVRFFTLSAPTGIGKTLSSLQCALELQKRIKEVQGYTPRIITAIPFINIIEQTKTEYENVFDDETKIIVHHRFADFSNINLPNEEQPIDKVLLQTESWEGDVILTTFVQLFQSIFTGENRLLKKVNKLAGSIIILDEIQSLPEGYMPLIGATLQMISRFYGTRFILMTATQPKLLEMGEKLLDEEKINIEMPKRVELLPDYEEYFENLNRTKFIPLLENKIGTEEFIKLFFDIWQKDKSALIVVNTIKRSIEIYQKLRNIFNTKNMDINIFYLSTNIIPLKRKEIIGKVKSILSEGKPVILVSTQTIEAGVDLDFDMAFRDFAPISSLIQTAGRVNREGKKGEFLPVYIVQLEDDSNYIYQLFNRQTTKNLLSDKKEILEPEYRKLTDNYYTSHLQAGVSDKSKYLWKEGIIKLDFEKLKEFNLISNIGEIYDVFIEKDSIAKKWADIYERILKYENLDSDLEKNLPLSLRQLNLNNFFQRKAIIKYVNSKISEYVIQVRVNKLVGNLPPTFQNRGDVNTNFYWVPFDQLKDFYDEETGFIDKHGEAYII